MKNLLLLAIVLGASSALASDVLPEYEIIPFSMKAGRGIPNFSFAAYKIDRKNNEMYVCGVTSSNNIPIAGDCRKIDIFSNIKNSKIGVLHNPPDGMAQPFWAIDIQNGQVYFCWLEEKCLELKNRK